MSQKEYIDIKKEFEDFKKELEDSTPLFDDDNLNFTDFDDYDLDFIDSDDDLDFTDFDDNKMENNSMESYMGNYPNLTLEDENILLNLIIKKDYSNIDDLNERREELIQDLKDLIEEFGQTNEFNELLDYYDTKIK